MFRLHKMYLINKVNVLSIGLILTITSILCLLSFLSYNLADSYFFKCELVNNLKDNLLILFKLGILNLFIFVFGFSFSKENDSYNILVDNFKNNIISYYVSKVFVLIGIALCFFLIGTIVLIISGSIFSNWFRIDFNFLYFIMNMLLLVLVYGMLSIIASSIIGSSYSSFIVIFFFVFGEIIKDININKSFIYIYTLFFPSLDLANPYISSYGILHLILLSIVYFLISILCYFKKANY